MKRKIALILALCMVFPLFSSCGAHLKNSFYADEMLSAYSPPSAGVYGGDVPYLSDLKLDIDLINNYAPDKTGALAIAKKYYDMCKPKMDNFLYGDYIFIVTWTPDFTGNHSDPKKASSLSMIAAMSQRQTDAAYFYTTVNAAVFELDPNGTAGALNLAAAIATCGEDLTAQKVDGINLEEFYSDSLLMYCYALRIAGQTEGNHIITALTGASGILYDMGELTACQTVLESVVELDKECCEAFDMLFNLYLQTNQKTKAMALYKKSPTYPMAATRQKAIETEQEDLKKQWEPPFEPKTEADVEAITKALEMARNASIADYYENIKIEQEERLTALLNIRRHVEQMRSKMSGANPPDMQYLLQYSTYDAYWNSGVNAHTVMNPWEEQRDKLIRQTDALFGKYYEKMGNLAEIAKNKDDYLNPNDVIFQIMLVTKINNMIGRFATNVSAIGDTMKAIDELQKIGYANQDRATYIRIFGSAVNIAGMKYYAIRNAVIRSYAPVMTHIMMVSDPDVQLYLMTKWDTILTTITVGGMVMLNEAYCTPTVYARPESGSTQMIDPGTAEREAQGRAEADLAREKAARDAFYKNIIDENSAWYKRENDNYGVKMDFVVFKFEQNDFITKTSTILDIGCFSGTLNTVTNHLRGGTTYNGTVKIGISSDKFAKDAVEAKFGASGQISFTTDGKGGVVPRSFQWKAGLEGSVAVGREDGTGGFGMSVGAGWGSDGGYAEIKGEISRFGGKVEAGIEVTTTKGAVISGGASISSEGNKEWNEVWDKTQEALKAEKHGYDHVLDRMRKWGAKEKVLWNGEYVVHKW